MEKNSELRLKLYFTRIVDCGNWCVCVLYCCTFVLWRVSLFVKALAASTCTWSTGPHPTRSSTRLATTATTGWWPRLTSTPRPPTALCLRAWREQTTPATSPSMTSLCPKGRAPSSQQEPQLSQILRYHVRYFLWMDMFTPNAIYSLATEWCWLVACCFESCHCFQS